MSKKENKETKLVSILNTCITFYREGKGYRNIQRQIKAWF